MSSGEYAIIIKEQRGPVSFARYSDLTMRFRRERDITTFQVLDKRLQVAQASLSLSLSLCANNAGRVCHSSNDIVITHSLTSPLKFIIVITTFNLRACFEENQFI